MGTLREEVKSLLSNHAPLATILTGGWMDAEQLPQEGATSDEVPRQADGVRIDPFGVIRYRPSREDAPRKLDPEQSSVEFYLYADRGYAQLERAQGIIKALLLRRNIVCDDRSTAYFHTPFLSGELLAEEYNNAPMMFVRFGLLQVRK